MNDADVGQPYSHTVHCGDTIAYPLIYIYSFKFIMIYITIYNAGVGQRLLAHGALRRHHRLLR